MSDYYIKSDSTQWWSASDPLTAYSPNVKNFYKDSKQDWENDGFSWFCTVQYCYFGCSFKRPKTGDGSEDINFVSGETVDMVAGWKTYQTNSGRSIGVGYSDATSYTQITVGAEALTASVAALLALALAQ